MNTTMKDGVLTARQQFLVDYLKERGEYVKQEEYLDKFGNMYDDKYEEEKARKYYHQTIARRHLTMDIKAIRENMYALISNKNGLKIATADEAAAFHKRRLWQAIKKLNKEKEILAMYGIRGQFDTDGKWVDFEEVKADGREEDVH